MHDYVPVPNVANWISMTPRGVYDIIKNKKMPAEVVRHGRTRRISIPVDPLDVWLEMEALRHEQEMNKFNRARKKLKEFRTHG